MTTKIHVGDCRDVLKTLPDKSIHMILTSPPYFGLRDYGTGTWEGGTNPACDHLGEPFRTKATINQNYDGGNDVKNAEGRQPMGQTCSKCGAQRIDLQIGLEPTPDEFVRALIEVMREARRVLRDDGTLWLNIGDSYARNGGTPGGGNRELLHLEGQQSRMTRIPDSSGLKEKDLIGIPWMVAFALRSDGWYLRQDIIWHKPNPMPESVTDRCTKAHEYVFLFSKSPRYFYDSKAIAEDAVNTKLPGRGMTNTRENYGIGNGGNEGLLALRNRYNDDGLPETRNKRSVWTIPTKAFAGAHFATMAPELAKTCILAGCPTGGTVLDPFGGAGTTGLVADMLQRNAVLIELNPEYAEMSRKRIEGSTPLFADVSL